MALGFLLYILVKDACFLGRVFEGVDLIKPVSNAHAYVCMYVCACVCPSKKVSSVFFDFNEIWHVGRGR